MATSPSPPVSGTQLRETAPPAPGSPAARGGSGQRPQPSIPALIFGIWALLVPLALQHRVLNADGDLARHLRHGEFMLQQRGLIRADPFSFTRPGDPFVGLEYGSQLLFALAHRWGGLPGVAVLTGLLIGATYALLARLLLRRGVDPLLAYLTAMVASVLGAVHWVARPHLVSLLAVVVLLHLLERRGRTSAWLALPLFALWSNLHGGFVYGLTLVGLYLAGSLAEMLGKKDQGEWRETTRYYAAVLGFSLLGTMLNPHGPMLYLHIVRHLGDSFVIDNTSEFMSPDFHQAVGRYFLVVLLLTIGALGLSRRRPSYPALFVILGNTAFALVSIRNIPLFGLTAVAVLALHVDPEWRLLPDFRDIRAVFARDAGRGTTLPWIAPTVVVLLLLGMSHGRVGRIRLLAEGFDPNVFPVEAVRRARAERLEGRIFSEFTWGGYLLYAWPEQRVFLDGGTDFYGAELLRTQMEIRSLAPDWRQRLRAWDIGLILVGSGSTLAYELTHERGWSLWYCDKTAALFQRTPAGTPLLPGESSEMKLRGCSPPRIPTQP